MLTWNLKETNSYGQELIATGVAYADEDGANAI